MFERFVRWARTRQALQAGELDRALHLARDPLIAGHRRTEALHRRARAGLLRRARARAEAGELSTALAEAGRLLAVSRDDDEARELVADLEARLDAARKGREALQVLLREARELASAGDVGGARRLMERAAERGADATEVAAVRRLVEARHATAREQAGRARRELAEGRPEEAAEALARGRSLDRDLEGAADLGHRIAAGLAGAVASRAKELLRAGDVAGAWRELRARRSRLPELAACTPVVRAVDDVARAHLQACRRGCEEGCPADAARAFLAVEGGLLEHPELQPRVEGVRAIARAEELAGRGSFADAAADLETAHGHLRWPVLSKRRAALRKADGHVRTELAAARELAAGGDLHGARSRLVAVLESWPMHEAARAELQVLDQEAGDRLSRLQRAREAAREGRLGEAKGLAMQLAVPGAAGEDARLILADVQARMDLVDRGLDEVRAALHKRDGGSAEGVRHCLRRVEELASVQGDHAGIAAMAAALRAELCGLERLAEAREALADPDRAAGLLHQVAELRGQLLREDRLDARILELGDELLAGAEEDLRAGRLRRVDAVCGRLAEMRIRDDFDGRLGALRDGLKAQKDGAARTARRGRRALERREFAAAEELLERARTCWADAPEVRRLESEVLTLRRQEARLDEVRSLTRKRDIHGAQRKMAVLPPTPAALRTRIFDMKQDLARAQGLDAGFLLRVDEGGEFVVLRGDSVSLGNVRERQTDLPILANIASRHARIERSMSFHGGMSDAVVAEGGEVRVGGRPVERQVLRSGDEIRLGSSLRLGYSLPSSRSLTALLTLRGGFQVAGTDRVLLLKDRGRDGRILIGTGTEGHVQVSCAEREIELFAHTDGQIRVRYEGQGTIGGRPFQGEHPVVAGEPVVCGPVSFVLQPWNPLG